MADVELKYFAVPDSDDPGRITYWRINDRQQIFAHPAKAIYGPTLWKQPGPGHEHVTPAGLAGDERRRWINNWYATVRADWMRQVEQAIDANRTEAAIRFGLLQVRCCCCGRALTDATSKGYGIGPECRDGLPAGVLAYLNEQIGRLHAESLAYRAAA